MSTGNASPSLKGLFSSLVGEVGTLLRTELQLARAETSEKVGQVAGAGVSLVIGGLLALAALLALLDAAAAYLRDVILLTPWLAHLAVGLFVALIALVFILKGRSNLTAGNLAPDRTIASLQQDAATVGERVR
jgi:hypothetical protein